MDTMATNHNLKQLNDDIINITDTLVRLSRHSEMVTAVSISIESIKVLTAQLNAMVEIETKELLEQDEKLSKKESEFYNGY